VNNAPGKEKSINGTLNVPKSGKPST